MKTISLVDDYPITLLEIPDIQDVPKRLSDLQKWNEDYEKAKDNLYDRVTMLDIMNDSIDKQLSGIISDHLSKIALRKAMQPLIVTENIENIYEKTKENLISQYKKLTSEEKLLWLQNIDFFITPTLLLIIECMALHSTHHFLVGGESRMGKSTLFRWLASQMIPEVRKNYTYTPFVHVEGTTDLRSLIPFYQRLILLYGGRYKERGREYELLPICNSLMMIARAKYVVIDEIGTMAVDIIRRKLIEFSNLAPPGLKIIGTSVDPAVFTEGDPELIGRFGTPIVLEKFTGNKLENLLYFFDLILPFGTSHLHTTQIRDDKGRQSKGMCQLIEERTGGILGDIVDLIRNSAISTIQSKADEISPLIIDKTWKQIHRIVS